MSGSFDSRPDAFDRNRGYNPAFIARVWEKKRREAARQEQGNAAPDPAVVERERRAAERFERLIASLSAGDRRINVRDVIAAVARRNGLTVADIVGSRRDRRAVAARREAIVEARRLRPDLALTALGRIFRRDHTSILHALRRAAEAGEGV